MVAPPVSPCFRGTAVKLYTYKAAEITACLAELVSGVIGCYLSCFASLPRALFTADPGAGPAPSICMCGTRR